MKPDPTENRLRERVWRGELTPAEQAELRAWLAAHPEAQTDWTDERQLNRLLDRLPDAPVPSNFTARVLQAVKTEECARQRAKSGGRVWFRIWVPRAAVTAVVASAALLIFQSRKAATQQSGVANSLSVVAGVESLPSQDALENFEIVRRLSPAPAPDEELLALMQ